ncbi:heparanase [Elysia marginata]|uniref:Heparanase n=1 Tax=Elysia marginata TaxID=1093978 RepID=A0AAV4IB01_9GAST|nr:heparanase [Elysia marginata]
MSHHFRVYLIFCSCFLLICKLDAASSAKLDFLRVLYNNDAQKFPQTQRIVVDASKALHITTDRYLSIAIDSDTIRWKWRGFDFSSKKLQTLAAGLSPTYIRFGGTYADFLHFNPEVAATIGLPASWTPQQRHAEQAFDSGYFEKPFSAADANFTMTGAQWDNMTVFCDKVGWDVMFDFNLFYWKNGLWDPTNADLLLRYSAARGVKIPAFQLGNEPNAFLHNFNFSIESDVLARDFKLLKSVLSTFSQYDASGLYGPDVTNLDRHGSARTYLQGFLRAGGCDAVTEVSIHHYYTSAKTATVRDFLNPKLLDSLAGNLRIAKNITIQECKYHKPVRMTETSSCYGGGAVGLSDAYVAGFMWLDKLGLAAKYQVTHVFRQTFYSGSYSLIDGKLNPNPDYFLSVLYKRLVVGPVFDVVSSTATLRLYAHCVRKGFYNYPDGALVVYYLNLEDQPIIFGSGQFSNGGPASADLFLLTPGDSSGLTSRFVKLNGEVLAMQGSDLPSMLPRRHVGDITVSAHSFGFIVFLSADMDLCKIYHRSKVPF